MNELVADGGALRAHLDEARWRVVFDASGAPEGLGGLAPRVPADPGADQGADPDGPPDELLLAAVRDLGEAAVRLEVLTSHRGRGLVGALSLRAEGVTGLVRVVGGAGSDGDQGRDGAQEIGVVPGVEVSVAGPDHVLPEVLRLLAPADDAWPDLDPLTMPADQALAVVRAVQREDDALLRATLDLLGVEEVPPLLEQLAHPVGDATLVLVRRDGSMRHLRLLLTDAGWVRLVMDADGRLTHTPMTTPQLEATLVETLAAALRPDPTIEGDAA